MNNNQEFTNEMFTSYFIMYAKILAFLIILTGITFVQPLFIPKDIEGTLFLQLSISTIKAFLILAYYMHLKYESTLFKGIVYFTGSILLIFFILVGIDSNMDDNSEDMFQQPTSMSHDSSKSH